VHVSLYTKGLNGKISYNSGIPNMIRFLTMGHHQCFKRGTRPQARLKNL
jgi:hypothetical protein